MDARPALAVLGTGARVIDDAGNDLGAYPVPAGPAVRSLLRRAPPFVHGAVMMRREAYQRAGGYRDRFDAAQDYDLWRRLPADAELDNLPDPLYAWRRHPRGVFTRARDRQLFFAAVARAFADERAATGRDSIELLARDRTPEELHARYHWRDRFARYLGEALVREGRPAEARRWLARAVGAPRSAAGAAAWWAASFPMALTPRARRAREARAQGNGARAAAAGR